MKLDRVYQPELQKETFLGNTIGIADGDILVFGPFATLEEAENNDCAIVETPARFLAVG